MHLSVPVFIPAVTAAVALLFTASSHAGTVVGNGTVVIQRAPDTLRVRVDIVGQGDSIAAAVSQLKQLKQAAQDKVLSLGATKDSVKLEAAKEVVNDDGSQPVDHLVRARIGRRSIPTPTPDEPTAQAAATVTTTLTADWPLAGADDEARLIAAHELRGKIKAALAQALPAKKLSPEEEELAEEAAAVGSDGSPVPGQPTFLFVKKLSDEEQDQATAQAFKKARREAESLAGAAGLKLGAIEQVTSSVMPNQNQNPYGNAYYWQMQAYAAQAMQNGSSEEREMLGTDSGTISATFQVSATFRAE